MKKNIAIFASGSGTNAENIAQYFKGHAGINVSLVLSNKPDAYVLERARILGIPSVVFDRHQFYETDSVLNTLWNNSIDIIVLAGFLWLVPSNILRAYPDRIVNIHPALLPRYGGKGMYGTKVHQAVKDSGDAVTGISIHFVNERYDEGQVIFQATCPVNHDDTPESIARKVHMLEYEHFPKQIEILVTKLDGPKKKAGLNTI
jgi:phosphoribosylglycinamide formyltransferase-1